jgi:hypothetical protein
MKSNMTKWHNVMTAGLVGPLAAMAAAQAAEPESTDSFRRGPNRVSVGAKFLFNVSADFQHFATPQNAGPGVGVAQGEHFYDDGYVRVDAGNNLGGQTWFWGYDSAAQLNAGNLLLHSAPSPADGLTHRENDPQYGFEVNWARYLGQFQLAKTPVTGGLEFSFGLTELNSKQREAVTGGVGVTEDAYAVSPLLRTLIVSGFLPTPYGQDEFGAPNYYRFPDSPGPTPRKTIATAQENLKLDGRMYGFKLGPFFEVPLGKRLAFQLNGGLALAAVDSEFRYTESYTYTLYDSVGKPYVNQVTPSGGSASKTDWLVGGYVGGRFNWAITKNWSLFLGAEYQNLGDYSLRAGNKGVKLNLGQSFAINTGVGYSF